jgi:hypothetical protein
MITIESLEDAYRLFREDKIPFRLLQEQALVFINVCADGDWTPSADNPVADAPFLAEAFDIDEKAIEALLAKPEASDDYNGYLGGEVYICETEQDLRQIVNTDTEWAEAHGGKWPNATDQAMSWDSCDYVKEKQGDPEYVIFLLCWNNAGGPVYYVPTKQPALKWDRWLDGLSTKMITQHWKRYPGHDVGFIVGDDTIVFDADSASAIVVLNMGEEKLDITPALIVETSKGVHHYFRLAQAAFATSDAHSTEKHPARLDIKTGRTMVVLPPSPGKRVVSCNVKHASDLSEVSQEFIDAIFEHNGRTPPRPLPPVASRARLAPVYPIKGFVRLRTLVFLFDPDCGYGDWFQVGVAICTESRGSDEGLALFDEWSSRGGKTYKGSQAISAKWASFDPNHPNPVTIRSLMSKLDAQGVDWQPLVAAAEDPFTVVGADTQGEK